MKLTAYITKTEAFILNIYGQNGFPPPPFIYSKCCIPGIFHHCEGRGEEIGTKNMMAILYCPSQDL